MQFNTLSKLKVCRRIRLDLWGDVLFSNRKLRLLRKFIRRRVIRKRKPGRRSKSYRTRRLLYVLRHHRAFINWFKTSKHFPANIRLSRDFSLSSLKKRLYSNSQVNLASLFSPSTLSSGARVNGARMKLFNNISSNLRNNFSLYFRDTNSSVSGRLGGYRRVFDEEKASTKIGFKSYIARTDRANFAASRLKPVRDRVTRRWSKFQRARWVNRYEILKSYPKAVRENYTIFSPRVEQLSKVYLSCFNELKTVPYMKVYSPTYSRFIKLRGPSWFLDGSRNFFMGFKRRFFISYLYFSKPTFSYFSTVYDYISNYCSSPVYSERTNNVGRFFLKRRLSSFRPSLRPELAFNSILKRSGYGSSVKKDRRIALFEVRRRDFLLNHVYRKLIRRKAVRVFKDDEPLAPVPYKLLSKRVRRSKLKLLRKETKKFKFFKPVRSRRLDLLSTRNTIRRGVRKKPRKFHKFRFKDFRGLARIFRGSVFTKKDYMDVLLNRNKQFRKKHKTVYKRDLRGKRRLKFFYGFMAESAFKSLFKHYTQQPNEFFFRFLRALESRLFMILYRSGLFNSVKMAKQLILHSHISVNGVRVSDFNYLVKRGDVLTFDKSVSLLGNRALRLNWVTRKVIPNSNLLVSYKLPAVIMAEDFEGLQDFRFSFQASSRKLSRFYKA